MGLIALNQMTYVRFLRPLTILNKSWFLSLNTLTSCLRYKKDLRQVVLDNGVCHSSLRL